MQCDLEGSESNVLCAVHTESSPTRVQQRLHVYMQPHNCYTRVYNNQINTMHTVLYKHVNYKPHSKNKNKNILRIFT